jgi:hypothetical protein
LKKEKAEKKHESFNPRKLQIHLDKVVTGGIFGGTLEYELSVGLSYDGELISSDKVEL